MSGLSGLLCNVDPVFGDLSAGAHWGSRAPVAPRYLSCGAAVKGHSKAPGDVWKISFHRRSRSPVGDLLLLVSVSGFHGTVL